MCGFAGRFHFSALPPDPAWSENADRLLRHRGPDGHGHFIDQHCELAHRRLALIDLSPTGHQPMSNEDGSIVVVFNGEIYNHRELRAELATRGHVFRGTSDTEVLAPLYERYGVEMVARLRGMFAFAIYDRQRRQVVLARDRFGIKPLYYASLRDQFVFASEIKAILALQGFTPEIDRQSCYDFLGFSYIPEPQTAFANIKALPAGCTLAVNERGERITEYYRVKAAPDQNLQFPAAVDAAAEALLQSVRAQSVADVPVAALLSGGIDSSLVVAAYCRTSEESPATFNVSFPDRSYDETPFARAVAERYNTRHHTLALEDVSITPELLQRLLLHFDQPFADTSLIPTYFVTRAIRDQGIICALSGDGGDEAFGGYASFWRGNQFARMMRLPKPALLAMEKIGSRLSNYTRDFGRQLEKAFQLSRIGIDDSAALLFGLSSYLSEEQKRELVLPDARRQFHHGNRWFDGYLPAGTTDVDQLSSRLTETQFRVSLVSDMLRKVDMMSMLNSIEVRVPLLDEQVVASGLALRHQFKTDGSRGKLVLREIARTWLPPQVAEHRKQGFGIPMDKMATPRLREMLSDLLLSPSARIRSFLNLPLIERWLEQFAAARQGNRSGEVSREGLYQRITMVLALELWLREHNLSW